jgi:hypothetical protein
MSNFLKNIKKLTARYCIENRAVLPVNRDFIAMKKDLAIKSFYGLPAAYQRQVKAFLKGIKVKRLYLVGSLASGAGIIPGVTPEKFIQLREKHSLKVRKKKSDIDLHLIDTDGQVVLKKKKSKVVNIESLPQRFEPSFLIYEKGKFI